MSVFRHARYRMTRLLARSRTGFVHLGVDPAALADVTIKEIRLVGGTLSDYEQFAAEARLARGAKHPGLARVKDLVPGGDLVWLITEHVAGPTLQEAVTGDAVFSEVRVLGVACGLGAALHTLHAMQPPFLVRSLAPSDVVLDAAGRPRLIDYGIGKFLNRKGETVAAFDDVLAPGTAAPEQLEGYADVRSDVYGLGALLYFALTGTRPTAEDGGADLASRRPDISERTRIVIASMLESDRARRPRTVLAAMDALGLLDERGNVVGEAAFEEPSGEEPIEEAETVDEPAHEVVPAREVPPARPRPRPSWKGLSTAAAVLGIVLAVFLFSQRKQETPLGMQAQAPAAPASVETAHTPAYVLPTAPLAATDGQAGEAAVTLASFPSGAQVRLDGSSRGITPITIESLPVGTHSVQLDMAGWAQLDYRLDLANGDHPSLTLVLQRPTSGVSGSD